MSGALDRFTEAARALGLQPEVRRFPEGTKTAVDAANAIGCDVGQIVKSLVFMAGEEPVLALTSGANRVDEGKLAAAAGAGSARRATPEEARTATGFAVGGTPPFGHVAQRSRRSATATSCRTRVSGLQRERPTRCSPLTPEELVRLGGAVVIDLAAR